MTMTIKNPQEHNKFRKKINKSQLSFMILKNNF